MIPDATPPAPAPGALAGRTEGTENSYLKRALWFAAHVGKNLGLEEPTPMEVVSYAMQRREQWSKSTWRQTKASLMFRYESMGTTASLEAVRLLREHGDQSMCLQTSKRTSGLRAKKVSDKKLSTVIKRIRASSSVYSAMLESWLIMGSICGLRPHEWTQSTLIWGAPSEIDPLGAGSDASQLDLERPYLRVENAKTSNGRGHGQYRHLDLSGMSMVMLGAIDRFATAMRNIKANGDYWGCYMACQQLLYRLNTGASIEGSQDPKWIQIYSARHVFSSRAKRVLKPEQVSAAMGHATDRTAHSHYGRRTNEGGAVGLIPVQTEVAKVRLKRKSYADAVLSARAKAQTSAGPAGESASS